MRKNMSPVAFPVPAFLLLCPTVLYEGENVPAWQCNDKCYIVFHSETNPCGIWGKVASGCRLWRFCTAEISQSKLLEYNELVYTTQVNGTFRARWLASSEVISQVLFTSEQPEKNKMAFVATFSQIKLLFGPLVIQLVWYILKQLFTSLSVKVARWISTTIHLHFGE